MLTEFAKLRTATDLLQKAMFDLSRMSAHLDDEYAAFDFFVTVEHLVDWHLPGDARAQAELRASETLLQVISHLASGAKHFRATRKQHRSVLDLRREGYADEGYIEEGYYGDVLTVDIAPAEAAVLGCTHIEAYQLGARAVAWWRERLGV